MPYRYFILINSFFNKFLICLNILITGYIINKSWIHYNSTCIFLFLFHQFSSIANLPINGFFITSIKVVITVPQLFVKNVNFFFSSNVRVTCCCLISHIFSNHRKVIIIVMLYQFFFKLLTEFFYIFLSTSHY